MRALARSLTTRGRAFVSAGATALVSAMALGLDDLARVGLLLLALPVVAVLAVTRSRHRLGLVRTVAPTRVTAGQAATVDLALSNDGRSPTGVLLLEEQVPFALGPRPRFVIDKMGYRWQRTVSYTVRSEVRGRFILGPMTVRVNDPFGLVEQVRTFRTTASVVVIPTVVPLPPIPLTGVWQGSGDNRPRDFAGGSAEDVTVREYRRGDDLRRVHWRSSAHAGELMVRREEQPWQSRATVLLDNRSWVHRGTGPASSFEAAVAAAASIVTHLAQRGFSVRLVTAEGAPASEAGWHEHGTDGTSSPTSLSGSGVGPLLEQLAVVAPAGRPALDTGWLAGSAQAGLLVAVLGTVTGEDGPVLTRMQQAAGTCLAMVVATDATGRSGRQVADLLVARGWRAVTAAPGEPLPAVWQRLGLIGRRVAEPTSAAVVEAAR